MENWTVVVHSGEVRDSGSTLGAAGFGRDQCETHGRVPEPAKRFAAEAHGWVDGGMAVSGLWAYILQLGCEYVDGGAVWVVCTCS